MAAVAQRRSLRRTIAAHPIAAYLVMYYPLTWIFSLPALLGKEALGVLPIDLPPQLGVLPSTILGLTGLAFLVTRIADGKAGTRELRRHYLHFRVGPQWYLLALFGVPIVFLLAALVLHGGNALSPFGNHAPEVLTSYLIPLVIAAAVINFWEEGGWMGFATTRLQRRWGPILASLAVAPLFGAQHLPYFFFPGFVTDVHASALDVVIAAFWLFIGLAGPWRIIITWVYNSTRGSVPIVGLLHASLNAVAGTVLTTFYPGLDLIPLYIALAIVALGLFLLTRGRLGYQPEPIEREAPVLTGAGV